MKINSPDDSRYQANWALGSLEIFFNGESMGKTRVPDLKDAKKILNCVVKNKTTLQDATYFNEAAKQMIGVDILEMSFSKDRRKVLYQGKFFAEA
mgnify:CR=1 FL=1